MEQFLMEKATVKAIIGPVDLNDAANTGLRFDMQKFKRVTFVVVAAAGTTPNAHTATLRQYDAASSGNAADLASANPYYHKADAATVFTKVSRDVAAAAVDLDALVADAKFIAVFEVLQEELTEGYRWVGINLSDSGGAQLGCVIAIGHEAQLKPAYTVAV